MPPTVQQAGRSRDRRPKAGERQKQLICRVKYSNTLPDIPFDPKFISYPFEANRFVQYNPTSLERNFKYDMLTEHDLGVYIDLINPDAYAISSDAKVDSEDERLLEEETTASTDSKRSRHHNTPVSWLRKTEYIASEYYRTQFKSEKAEAKVGFNIKKLFNPDDLYKDRESQLRTIERTFQAVKDLPKKHHSKPGVTAEAVLDVFPDFTMWKFPFAQVMFDSDPSPQPGAACNKMSQAMIRGMKDESGEQFVAYFLPTDESMAKREEDKANSVIYRPDEPYDHMLSREYTWNVKNKATKGYEEMYFFLERNGQFCYNELETRVRLTKRRKTGGGPAPKTRLIVRHRPMNDTEEGEMERRMTLLEPLAEDEEEASHAETSESEGEKEKEKSPSRSASRSASSSESSGSSSGSSSESEDEGAGKASADDKKSGDDEAEIFGSDSD
ncbi:RNA polymerase II-associated factor 1 homolog [Watersipora subatra]|uniref:RNA polymerase II-associated factor 1 homolog n=1 Tax=Watersipora subatra TaxID=2589382 RepID=UPI00355C6796